MPMMLCSSGALLLPEDVVDADDVLFLRCLAVTDHRSARLEPHVAAVLVHQPVVVRQYLALAQY